MNKQQLAAKIWAAANKMRSKIDANEYKDYFLGFIFYKFLSDSEEAVLKKDGWSDADIKADLNEKNATDVAYLKGRIGYFISYEHLFSTWIDPAVKFDASQVTIALSAFARNIAPEYKRVFDGIFKTLDTKIANLGETNGVRTKAIANLLSIVKDVPTTGDEDYDVLGYVYEYLIGKFAAHAGKKAGEFYTPHEVGLLIAEIIAYHHRKRNTLKIYDPTSGSGSLLLNIGRTVSQYIANRDAVQYYAQELKDNTFNLTRMNLVMRGIKPANIFARNADTLAEDWPMIEDGVYNPLYVDAVVSNPPYSAEWDSSGRENDVRYRSYGLAPKTKADYAFLLHDLYHVKPDGIMAIVLPHGVLFRGKYEKEEPEAMIRRNLIEKNQIDAIIGLPANIFFGTGIPTIVMVLKPHRDNDDVLFIDASRLSVKEGKQNRLTAGDIRRIVDTWIARKSDDLSFACAVSRDDIRRNGYNLNIPRYVESATKCEHWDLSATLFGGIPKAEIDAEVAYWDAFPGLREALFKPTRTAYTFLKPDPAQIVGASEEVRAFLDDLAARFKDFPVELDTQLIQGWKRVRVSSEMRRISARLFELLDGIPLIDCYAAYQILYDQWQIIGGDLEILQDEGFDAVRAVDPKMVLKKNTKTGEEVEVQDGWEGRIMPFDLVQRVHLPGELAALETARRKLTECQGDLDEAQEAFDEEELHDDFWNADKGVFIPKGVGARVKKICGRSKKTAADFPEDSFEAKILRAHGALERIKTVKSDIRRQTFELETKTRQVIGGLTDANAKELLHEKWIAPIVVRVLALGDKVTDNILETVKALAKKYEEPLEHIVGEQRQIAKDLCEKIAGMTGSAEDLAGLRGLATILEGEK